MVVTSRLSITFVTIVVYHFFLSKIYIQSDIHDIDFIDDPEIFEVSFDHLSTNNSLDSAPEPFIHLYLLQIENNRILIIYGWFNGNNWRCASLLESSWYHIFRVVFVLFFIYKMDSFQFIFKEFVLLEEECSSLNLII